MVRILRGQVVSGVGDFGRWIEELHDHYHRKTGLHLFPGTLNVELNEVYSVPANCLRLEAHEYGGAVSVNLVPCRIFGRPGYILRTDSIEAGHGIRSKHVVEVACEVKLRSAHGLTDGDEVEIAVDV